MSGFNGPESLVKLSEALNQLYVIDGEFPLYDVTTGHVTMGRKGHRPLTGFELVRSIEVATQQLHQMEKAVANLWAILDGRPPTP